MSVGVQKAWSTTAATNATADTNVNYQEGSGFKMPQINDSARAAMAAVKGWADQIGGGATYGGSADAYTITSAAVAAIDTAYAAGMRFALKANHTNTTATPTLNVDGVGAVTITHAAGVALAAGDIVSGGVYDLVYNATGPRFELLAGGVPQPRDATLTSFAATSWASGRPLVELTATDTVALTLEPSVTSVTASNATGATTPAATLTNTTDNASVRVLTLQGDRATPTNVDAIYASFMLSDGAGNQDEFARITVRGQDVTSGSEDGQLRFAIVSAGTLADKLGLEGVGNTLFPVTNDGLGLGTGAFSFSDLFLASGGVVNWNNGDVVMTHSANALEVTGGGFAAPLLQVSGVGGETLAAATHRNRMLLLDGDITIDDGTFAAGDCGVMIADGTDRTVTRAAGLTMYVNGVDSATATIPAHTVAGFATESSTVIHLTGSAF